MTLLRDARITRDGTCWEAMERQGIGCVAPVISLQKLKNFLVQPKFRSLTQHGPGSSGDETRSGGMDTSQMHSMYGNRTGGNSTSPPVSTSNSALLVVPQPINAASKPPSLTATNCTGRKYQCKMCPQIFMHKSAMQHHSREIHRGEIKPHQCQQCLKSFSSNHQLTQHIRIHTGEKPYKCSYCDRRFKQLSHVQQHTRLHTGERPYKCHLANCGRAFIQLSNLQQHLRNHDNQMERAKNRPYLCNICGKGFASESSLRTHRSKACSQGWGQMGQNPLKFSVTPPNVESEARRNSAEGKSAGFNNTSEQHAALIGGANSQSCPVCHKICLNGEALMEHMRTTHKDPNASGTPSKKKRGRSSRSSAATTTASNGDSVRNTSPLSSTVLGIRVSTSKHSLTAISNSLTSSALTAVSTTAVCGSGSARGIMSTMGMSMSNFLVPSMVGSSTFGGHSGGPTQGCHYPHHPLVARPQPSFLSL